MWKDSGGGLEARKKSSYSLDTGEGKEQIMAKMY